MTDVTADLPVGWTYAGITEFSELILGQSPQSSTYNTAGAGLPFFQGKAEFGEIYPEVRKYCSAPLRTAEAGAILLSVRAPVGPTNLARVKCCIGRGLAAIQPIEPVDARFVLHLLRSIAPQLAEMGTGSTFEAVSKEDLLSLRLPLPPLREQHRIVAKIEELFSDLDKAVESLTLARAQLKTYRQALLKAAFEGKLTADWRAANPDKLEPPEALLARIREARAAASKPKHGRKASA